MKKIYAVITWIKEKDPLLQIKHRKYLTGDILQMI